MQGKIRVPSDKSISHRAVLFAGLAEGVSHLKGLLPSDDVLSSLGAIRALGARTDLSEGLHGLSGTIEGFAGAPHLRQDDDCGPIGIDCGNSGTTTRLLLGMTCGLGVDLQLHGDASLSTRPMERVMKPLRQMGARFESEGGRLPVRVLPTKGLEAVSYETEQASAQVKSSILLAGLQARGTTTVTEPAVSRDHTERLLPAFGVPVRVEGLSSSVEGPAKLHAHDMTVPGDPSSAAFVAVTAAIVPGSDVTIEEVALNPTRTGAFAMLRRMGADISYENERSEGAEPVGDVCVRYSPGLRGTRIAGEKIPSLIDEIPVLALAAAAADGETVFESAGELRVKESDRFQAILDFMDAIGVLAWGEGDDLHIEGGEPRAEGPLRVETHHDHRLAMSWWLAGVAFGLNIELDDPDCVSVSWPGFYDDVRSLL